MSSVPYAAFAIALAVAVAAPRAQDREPAPTRIRVVSMDDLPRPGVTLVSFDPKRLREAPADGWVRTSDERILKHRFAVSVRTDPEGIAELPALSPGHRVDAGAPFVGSHLERDGDDFKLRVSQQELFTVRVLDAAGEHLRGFPVALYAGGREEAIARTGSTGLALLGMEPTFEARLTIAPSGWVGPRDAFPTVATVLARARAEMTVPAYGQVRLRPVRGGKPTRVRAGDFQVYEPSIYSAHWHGAAVNGFELPCVALGQTLRGRVSFDGVTQMFQLRGPTALGECITFDVELERPMPCLALRLSAEAAGAVGLPRNVDITVHTDQGHAYFRTAVEGGAVNVKASHLHGTRILRVDVDGETEDREANGRVTSARAWWATRTVDLAIADGALDLGEFALRAHPPLLRGIVLDETGAPVANALLTVTAKVGDTTRERGVGTGFDGRFLLVGPWPRDAEGTPASVVLSYAHGTDKRASQPLAPGSKVTFTVPKPAQIDANVPSLVARFADLPQDWQQILSIEALRQPDDPAAVGVMHTSRLRGVGARPIEERDADGTRLVWRGLRTGRYTLRVLAPLSHEALLQIEDLHVTPVGCADARLTDLRIADGLHVVTLRVLDATGVPVAGASIEMHTRSAPKQGKQSARSEPPRSYSRRTDGQGRARVTVRRGAKFHAVVRAEGHRTLDVGELVDGADLRLEPAGTLQVAVLGLPPDIPRDKLSIYLRHAERGRLDLTTDSAVVGGEDTARVALPARGRYHVQLMVATRTAESGWGTTIATRDVDLGEGAPTRVEFPVDAATLDRLRRRLSEVGK